MGGGITITCDRLHFSGKWGTPGACISGSRRWVPPVDTDAFGATTYLRYLWVHSAVSPGGYRVGARRCLPRYLHMQVHAVLPPAPPCSATLMPAPPPATTWEEFYRYLHRSFILFIGRKIFTWVGHSAWRFLGSAIAPLPAMIHRCSLPGGFWVQIADSLQVQAWDTDSFRFLPPHHRSTTLCDSGIPPCSCSIRWSAPPPPPACCVSGVPADSLF